MTPEPNRPDEREAAGLRPSTRPDMIHAGILASLRGDCNPNGDDYDRRICAALDRAIDLLQAPKASNPWQEAILDALAVSCMDAPASESPRDILRRIISFHEETALDPAVSERAAALLRRDAPREGASVDDAMVERAARAYAFCDGYDWSLLDAEGRDQYIEDAGKILTAALADRAPREGGEAVDLSAFLPAVKLWRSWAELGEFAEKIGPVSFRKPVEEYQRRIAEADRLLALIEAHRPQPAGALPFCEDHGREFVRSGDDGEFCNECAADGFTGELCWPEEPDDDPDEDGRAGDGDTTPTFAPDAPERDAVIDWKWTRGWVVPNKPPADAREPTQADVEAFKARVQQSRDKLDATKPKPSDAPERDDDKAETYRLGFEAGERHARSTPPLDAVGALVGKDIPGLLAALRNQRQVDADGTECGVSRQAVDEAINIIASLGSRPVVDEAMVERAARAIGRRRHYREWDDIPASIQQVLVNEAEAALTAALRAPEPQS